MSSGVAESLIWIHFLCRYIPSRSNLYKWKLEKRLRSKLVSIIQARLDSKERCGYGNDLLGLMLEACHKPEGQILSRDAIVDECKTFFFAGQETTAAVTVPKAAQHHLNISPDARPVKQRPRPQAPDRQQAVRQEVERLLAADFIEEVKYPQWLSNVVLIKKLPLLQRR